MRERELTHERERVSLSLSGNLGQAALQESGSSNLVATLFLGFLNLSFIGGRWEEDRLYHLVSL